MSNEPNPKDVIIKVAILALSSRLSTATPEQRAAADAVLRDTVGIIRDFALLALYRTINNTHDRIVIATHPDLRQLDRHIEETSK